MAALKSTAESYYIAAFEHLSAAQQMFDDEDYENRYYLTHILSGLAVECMLRAYLRRKTDQFDARHDLFQLAKESRFIDLVPKRETERLGALFSTMNTRWKSNHRYFPRREIERYLQSVGAEKGVSGELMEDSGRTMLEIATEVIKLGEVKWRTP